jgi:hypothetical protein
MTDWRGRRARSSVGLPGPPGLRSECDVFVDIVRIAMPTGGGDGYANRAAWRASASRRCSVYWWPIPAPRVGPRWRPRRNRCEPGRQQQFVHGDHWQVVGGPTMVTTIADHEKSTMCLESHSAATSFNSVSRAHGLPMRYAAFTSTAARLPRSHTGASVNVASLAWSPEQCAFRRTRFRPAPGEQAAAVTQTSAPVGGVAG